MTFEENFDLGLILMRKFDLGLQILVRYISFKEKQISEVETEASWAKLDPEMVLRATLFARVIQQLGRWAQKKSSHRPYPALDTFKISCLDPASTRPVRF